LKRGGKCREKGERGWGPTTWGEPKRGSKRGERCFIAKKKKGKKLENIARNYGKAEGKKKKNQKGVELRLGGGICNRLSRIKNRKLWKSTTRFAS